jgi:hypothetical protein
VAVTAAVMAAAVMVAAVMGVVDTAAVDTAAVNMVATWWRWTSLGTLRSYSAEARAIQDSTFKFWIGTAPGAEQTEPRTR